MRRWWCVRAQKGPHNTDRRCGPNKAYTVLNVVVVKLAVVEVVAVVVVWGVVVVVMVGCW